MLPKNTSLTSWPEQHLLREQDLADRWQVSTRTLQRWRSNGAGPPFIRVEGSIRYRAVDIDAYEDRMRANWNHAQGGTGR